MVFIKHLSCPVYLLCISGPGTFEQRVFRENQWSALDVDDAFDPYSVGLPNLGFALAANDLTIDAQKCPFQRDFLSLLIVARELLSAFNETAIQADRRRTRTSGL